MLHFVHGGPGDATNPYGYAVFRSWLRYFTIVQWDQRGAGRTLGKNGPASASMLTVERVVADGVELAEHLCQNLQKDKIILVGHSFSSIVAVLMARDLPSRRRYRQPLLMQPDLETEQFDRPS